MFFSNYRISRWLLLGIAFTIVDAAASQVRLAWDSNPEPDIAGYTVYYGTESGSYPHQLSVGGDITATISDLSPETSYFFVVTATNESGLESLPSDEVFTVTAPDAAGSVVGRYVFYNNSAWDGNDPAASVNDDTAIAPDKFALLPGGAASFSNYTSYSRGINGVMIDVKGLADPSALSSADFACKLGNDSTPSNWATSPASLISSVSVRQGHGLDGSDRVTLIFGDNAVQNKWLEVTMFANAITGLAANDIFYFGNAVGETGNSSSNAVVNGLDQAKIRVNPLSSSSPGSITNPFDINRDRFVNGFDEAKVRVFSTGSSSALNLIDLPLGSPAVEPLAAGSGTDDTSEPLVLGLSRSARAGPDITLEFGGEGGPRLVISIPRGSQLEFTNDLGGLGWVRVGDDLSTFTVEETGASMLWTFPIDRSQRFFRIVPAPTELR